jgi:hypothetical protein
MLVKVQALTSLTCTQHISNHYFHNWWWINNSNLHPPVHSTLLHRLATASKPNNCNLWQWHERESHYGMQESSRTTGIQTVCIKCVSEQCCWLLTLYSLRDTWMNEWMNERMNEWMKEWWTNEWVLSNGGKTLKRKPEVLGEQPVPILLCHHKYIHTGQGLSPCNGSDMLTTINPTHSTAPPGTRINFRTLYSKASNNHT